MLTAITGGIGSGKSVVSQILRILGYPVYDCDSRARTIMDSDCGIHRSLCEQIHPQAVTGGIVDRQLISSIVFNDTEALAVCRNGDTRAERPLPSRGCDMAGDSP